MRRRAFLAMLGGAAAWPLAARAQVNRVRQIGFLLSSAGMEGDVLAPHEIAAFQATLRTLGWTEGDNVQTVYRWSEGSSERLRINARELVGIADVIVAVGGPALQHLLVETRTVPIVFTVVFDPAASGFVDNFARPGGNTTGFSTVQDSAIAGKWVELLKEIVSPALSRVMVVMEADSAPQRVMRDMVLAAASNIGVALVSAEVRDLNGYEMALETFARDPGGALIVLPNAITVRHPREIHVLASRYRLPAIYSYPIYARTGGLLSYGSDPVKQFPEAARYVNRILRGEKAGDLPLQAPTKFELVINLNTAKMLGLTVPPTLLARADEVIE